MKKKMFVLVCVIICVLVVFIRLSQNNLINNIIKYIDERSTYNDSCVVLMKEITPFEWDKMLIYQVGSSSVEISELLNVDYDDSVDLMSGIIFVKDNKVVYKESMIYSPEKPNKLSFRVGKRYDEEKYNVYTPDNAIFEGVKIQSGSETLYQLKVYK